MVIKNKNKTNEFKNFRTADFDKAVKFKTLNFNFRLKKKLIVFGLLGCLQYDIYDTNKIYQKRREKRKQRLAICQHF